MSKLFIRNRFGVTPNELLENEKISFKAKGLFAYIQSRPENWDFSAARIALHGSDGSDSISTWLQELEKYGYLKRIKYKRDDGTWAIDYELSIPENPVLDNPGPENPGPENPETNKEGSTKKEIQTRIYSNILSVWNEQEIIRHRNYTAFKKQIDKRLKTFSEEEIIQSIRNYGSILNDAACFFSYKWTLWEFIQRENGMPVFLYKTPQDYTSPPNPTKPTRTVRDKDYNFFP